ncbi:hypothetical protein [Rhizobium sp. FKY42]|uniref:hypothetical protein n=1 Tax=Rhizobium sp. FKY42 TaxID=2562310 RepID=UPI001FF0081D|nr:hypothetical protein [Rhizobium sp. FKY42]
MFIPHIKRKLAHAGHSFRSWAPNTVATNLQGQTMGKFAARAQIAKTHVRQEAIFPEAKRLEEGIVCFQTGNIEMKMADVGKIRNRSDDGQIADLRQFPFNIEGKRRTEGQIRDTSCCEAGPCFELRASPLRSLKRDLHTQTVRILEVQRFSNDPVGCFDLYILAEQTPEDSGKLRLGRNMDCKMMKSVKTLLRSNPSARVEHD